MTKGKGFDIPKEVRVVIATLEDAGFEAYLVGGCVRNLIQGREPKDWDITTNAVPEEIIALFPETFYNNDFGTVSVVNKDVTHETLKVVEITPFRVESAYSNFRHPDKVEFSKNLDDDLERRDFTINALAYDVTHETVIDRHGGLKDLKDGIIRAVGVPEERFGEDALRIMRAIRIFSEYNFTIEQGTRRALEKMAPNIAKIAKERIRDEFSRTLLSPRPMEALMLMHQVGVLQYIVPELEKGVGEDQNQAHSFTVFEHILRTVQHAADKGWPLEVRLAALFHDIGKPHTKRMDPKKKDWSFHGHEVVGAKIAKKNLRGLHYPNKVVDKVEKLVRWHMFFSDPDKITLSAVRRIVRNVGEENVWDLLNVRICDRIGTGRPKEQPFRLRKYVSMVEEALRSPVSVQMLAIDGARLMDVTHETPGPRIGYILHALLEDVLDDPKKNTSEYLEARALELQKLDDTSLKALGEKGKLSKEREEEAELKEIRKKYHVDV